MEDLFEVEVRGKNNVYYKVRTMTRVNG